ncbi:MAG: pseudouridine synthase [Bacteroidia bacterium]
MDILYEDNHLIAVNKPFGMPSQGDETGDLSAFDWVKEYIRRTYSKPGNVYLALLHRIDRPTGGILLMAKTSKAAARMSEQFQHREIGKTYLAITERVPEPPQGELVHHLRKLSGRNIMQAFRHEVHGSKPARLSYRVLGTVGGRALVEVSPLTGRQHQIRVQLASIGCTIQGDVKYGKTDFLPNKCIALLAWALQLEHPTLKTRIDLRIDLPDDDTWRPFAGLLAK